MKNNIKKDIKNLLIGFGVIVLYLIASIFSYEFINLLGINYNSLSLLGKAICSLSYEIILTLIIIYIYKNNFIPDFKQFIKNNIKYFNKYIKYWFLALGLMMLSNSIILQFTTSNVAENQEIIVNNLSKAPVYTFIVTVIVAPFLEELVFRLSFKKIFAHSNFLFIFFSGFIFGLMHVISGINNLLDLLFIIPYSIPGFIFAYVYYKSKNIFVPISLHLIHNGLSMCLQILLLMLK